MNTVSWISGPQKFLTYIYLLIFFKHSSAPQNQHPGFFARCVVPVLDFRPACQLLDVRLDGVVILVNQSIKLQHR